MEQDGRGDVKGTKDCVKFEGELQERASVTSTSLRDSPFYTCVCEHFTLVPASRHISETKLP